MGRMKDLQIDQDNFEREREYTDEQELSDEEAKRMFRQNAKETRETLAYKMAKKAERKCLKVIL